MGASKEHSNRNRRRPMAPEFDGQPPIGTLASEIQSRPLHWLWKGRIPVGMLTVFDGDPGEAKSTVMFDIAARVSSGQPMPDGTHSDLRGPGGVILASLEDDPARTIRPRLEAAGADLSRILILQSVGTRLITLEDLDTYEAAIQKVDARLVVIDPLMAQMAAKDDAHKDQDMRRRLAPLAALAERCGVAIVVVRHLNKDSSRGNPLYRGGGSIGIIGAARSGLMVFRHPPDSQQRVLAVSKANLAPTFTGLAFSIGVVELGRSIKAVRVQWEGEVTVTTRELLEAQDVPAAEQSELEEAKEFLRDALQHGPRPAAQLLEDARANAISEKTLRRAKAALGVRAVKRLKAPGDAIRATRWDWLMPGTTAKPAPEREKPSVREVMAMLKGKRPISQEAN